MPWLHVLVCLRVCISLYLWFWACVHPIPLIALYVLPGAMAGQPAQARLGRFEQVLQDMLSHA
eukprot:4896166-Alexandrium_andersonii.AAC.1